MDVFSGNFSLRVLFEAENILCTRYRQGTTDKVLQTRTDKEGPHQLTVYFEPSNGGSCSSRIFGGNGFVIDSPTEIAQTCKSQAALIQRNGDQTALLSNTLARRPFLAHLAAFLAPVRKISRQFLSVGDPAASA